MVDAASRSDGDESTNYDYDSVIDGMVSLHWLKIMVAAARAPLTGAENTTQGRRLPRPRRLYNFDTRLNWNVFMEKFHNRAEFKRHIWMSAGSFNKLTNLIRHALKVDEDMANLRGGPIIPEICLYCCLRYLAGGSYSNIRFFTGISTASLYRLVWKVVFAINDCDTLAIIFPTTPEECKKAAEGFSNISKEGCISNRVAVLDGYHLEIRTPPKKQVGNVCSFFSGHYQMHGVNVQAACDHNCRFLFLGVAGPGVMGDRDAVKIVTLNRLIESMPPLFCAIGDCAYTPTEHLVPIYRGADAQRPK
ncbi:hypothetical protein MHU86_21824 [Fragilaria crotonensis]|nr:hypothetical protein MHU86_21824 [Fragilaria crotonensis]